MKKSLFVIAKIAALTLCSLLFFFSACSLGMATDNQSDSGFYEASEESEESGDSFEDFKDNVFIKTSEQNVSTFSLDADSSAYSYMRKCLENNKLPSQSSVRIEEYLNYFTFDYKDPEDGKTVALNSEISVCPWNTDHYLVRLGIKGKSLEKENLPRNNYVFLIDVSGSMDGKDRLDLLKKGLCSMLDYMNDNDRVSIVTYSGKEELALESTLVSDKETIKNKINSLTASGCTNGVDAITLAYNEALKNYIDGGNNRIIMGTDGDFNVGTTSTDELLEMVENYANQEKSVYLTACGFGYGNWNDAMMEKISNKGNGTYVYVDCEEEMKKVFVDETSRFISVANDCKAQVTFNKDFVTEYRLIGYENRVLNSEDFENDDVDAAEIGAGQTVTVLYEIVPAEGLTYDSETKEFSASLYNFDFRYKESLNSESILLSSNPVAFTETASENMRFAQAVAAYGMLLRNSDYRGSSSFSMVQELLGDGFTFDPYERRKAFADLVLKANELSEK